MNQYGIDGNTDENQEALKAQRKQRFQVILSDMALLMIAPCGHRHRSQTDHHIDLNHSAVDYHENHDGQDAHRDADQETLQEQTEQRADIHPQL